MTGEVLRVIRSLAEQHTTMVIVTHEMAFARDVADQVIFMDGGVIVEQGPAREVIDHPQQERTRQFLARSCYHGSGELLPRLSTLTSSVQAPYPSFSRKRLDEIISPHLLSPQKLRFCGAPLLGM